MFHEKFNQSPDANSVSQTRNSKFREMTKLPIDISTKFFHRKFPSITPNQITTAGVIGVGIGGALAAAEDRKRNNTGRAIALGILGAASILDAFDGSLARVIEAEDPTKKNPDGQLIDTAADRIQETTLAIFRVISAQKRGDNLGEVLALLSGISNGAPSLLRAIAESRGIVVPEGGGSIIGFFGTRLGRTISGILSTDFAVVDGKPVQKTLDKYGITFLPQIENINLQNFIDAGNIATNTFTAVNRFKAISNSNNDKPINLKIMEEAETRTLVLSATMAATVMAAGITYSINKRSV